MSIRAASRSSSPSTDNNPPADGAPGFYEPALPKASRHVYRQARRTRGLENEIALLRLKIFDLLNTTQNDESDTRTPAIARLVDLLIKALRADGVGEDGARQLLDSLLDEESARILDTAREK